VVLDKAQALVREGVWGAAKRGGEKRDAKTRAGNKTSTGNSLTTTPFFSRGSCTRAAQTTCSYWTHKRYGAEATIVVGAGVGVSLYCIYKVWIAPNLRSSLNHPSRLPYPRRHSTLALECKFISIFMRRITYLCPGCC
jgi:hypothetical protein